ncbi:MAG: glycosyltransferase family 4 protein [Anaerolineales bacterium]|nr:glycosyltransferase family 4 protein [Anaerolineales bacterium]
MTLKVVFCWSDISGYMAACWRALHRQPQIDCFVVAFQAKTETAFSDRLMDDIPCRLLNVTERQNTSLVKRIIREQQPDIVVLCGWFHPPYRALPFAPELAETTFIMGMDTPWQATLKQRLGPVLLGPYLKRLDRVVVTGERSWQYARQLGIAAARLRRGLYGIDYRRWSPLYGQRQAYWPRAFLFAGRYAPEKGVEVLTEAYRYYRNQSDAPWPLVCCGQGPLAACLQGQPGLIDRGFVQPEAMDPIWRQAGVFILPSRFDPWPLALVEAAAAGLPIICTDRCGSAVEVVREGYNGLIIPPDDSEALAQAMLNLHHRYDDLPIWGARAQHLAAPYAADVWAERWRELVLELRRPAPTTNDVKLALRI